MWLNLRDPYVLSAIMCVCVCVFVRVRSGACFSAKIHVAPGHAFFLVHLVSSFLSPLSLSLSLSFSLSRHPLLFQRWRGDGEGVVDEPGRGGEGGGGGGGGSHHGYNATTNIHQVVKIKTKWSAL